MTDLNTPEDLPLGLMMQLGQNINAMNTFASLNNSEKAQMVDYIKSAATGDEAKARINEVLNTLGNHQGLF